MTDATAKAPPKTKRKPSGLVPITQQSLPLWSDRVRGAPNALARSALFTCADKRKERRSFEKALIVSVAGQEIRYTGKELRQDDLTVWLQLVHLARMQPVGDVVEVSANALLTAIDWGSNAAAYNRLRDSVSRMREGSIWVARDDGKGFSGNLIMRMEWSDAGSATREKWRLYLDPNILVLFRPDDYTLLNCEARLRLSAFGQWLLLFFSTHASPYPYKVETLYRLCGSTSKTLSGFRRNLLENLEALKSEGLIVDVRHDTKSDTVQVLRRQPKQSLVLAGQDSANEALEADELAEVA